MVAHDPCPQVRLPRAGRTGCSPLTCHLVSSVTESYCSRHVGYPLNRERVFLLRTKSGSATIVKDEVSIGTLRARRGREEELWHSSSSLGASSRPQRMIVLWHSVWLVVVYICRKWFLRRGFCSRERRAGLVPIANPPTSPTVAHEPCPQVRLPRAGRTGCSPLTCHLVSSVTESYCSRHVGYPLNRERVFLLRTKSGSATIVKDEVSIGTLRARRGREEELWHSSSSLGASSRPQRMIVLWHSVWLVVVYICRKWFLRRGFCSRERRAGLVPIAKFARAHAWASFAGARRVRIPRGIIRRIRERA